MLEASRRNVPVEKALERLLLSLKPGAPEAPCSIAATRPGPMARLHRALLHDDRHAIDPGL